jgi:hypothetical protein
MTKLLLSVILSLGTVSALAGEEAGHGALPEGAVYYAGKQPVGIAGDEVDCFVEAVFSPKGSYVEVRTLLADAHDATELIGKGEVKAKFSKSKGGYYFSTSKTDAPVQEMLLTAKTKKSADGMGITFADEGHLDTISCNNLNKAKDLQLSEVMEMFEHFEDYIEEDHGDGDHDNHGH